MSQFKIGDMVKVTSQGGYAGPVLGHIGQVVAVWDHGVSVNGFPEEACLNGDLFFDFHEVEPVGVVRLPTTNMTKAEYVEFVRKTFDDMHALIQRKNKDYSGKGDDPFANFRRAEKVGVDPIAGVVVRLLDKVARVESFFQNGSLQNEGLDDAFLDLIGYSCIALGMLKERKS